MTNREAIDIIKSECYIFNPLNFDRTIMINTALDMAIKALEQEPCEDAISRQAVLDAMCELSIPTVYKGNPTFIIDYVEVINNLPSVTPRKKIGRWIFKHNSSDIWCSCCDENYDEIPQKFNYCPNCGAKMEEVEE